MKKIFFIPVSLLLASAMSAQYKVRFVVTEQTTLKHDSIYITGTFSNWDSAANHRYLLSREPNGSHSITLEISGGDHRYKFTRGSWLNVEKFYDGDEALDKRFTLPGDSVLYDTIFAWRDEVISDKWAEMSQAANDSSRLHPLFALSAIYSNYLEWKNADSAFYYIGKTLLLVRQIKDAADGRANPHLYNTLFYTQDLLAKVFHGRGNFSKELELRMDNLKIAEDNQFDNQAFDACSGIANVYASMQDYNRMLEYSKKMYALQKPDFRNFYAFGSLYMVATSYFKLNQLDSALIYVNKIVELEVDHDRLSNIENAWANLVKASKYQLAGDIYLKMGDISAASKNYRLALPIAWPSYAYEAGLRSRYGLAQIFYAKGRVDSAFFYARRILPEIIENADALQTAGVNMNTLRVELTPFIADLYRLVKKPDSAYYFLRLSTAIRDSLYNVDKVQQFQNLTFNQTLQVQEKEQEIRASRQQYQSRIRLYVLIAGLAIALFIAFLLYRNNKHKQTANIILEQQKQKVERTLEDLKATQAQLIQSEKMASLGALTAGIAHEIQNPLNFVNNFSELNKELVDELQDELKAGKITDAIAVSNDIKNNEEKINYHGKRADAIVKGMLQHSRSSSGIKEPTDINALCDEYIRLSYNGLRAKDKSFNATVKTDFDPAVREINIIPQDIGRVVLNLLTNAFYAVSERKKQQGDSFDPIVTVATKMVKPPQDNGKPLVKISVRDNGNGIPQKVLDKIFQPFFTTKPTGQGTGLGLSMSYDIITKGHGGALTARSEEGQGATFTIEIPIT